MTLGRVVALTRARKAFVAARHVGEPLVRAKLVRAYEWSAEPAADVLIPTQRGERALVQWRKCFLPTHWPE